MAALGVDTVGFTLLSGKKKMAVEGFRPSTFL